MTEAAAPKTTDSTDQDEAAVQPLPVQGATLDATPDVAPNAAASGGPVPHHAAPAVAAPAQAAPAQAVSAPPPAAKPAAKPAAPKQAAAQPAPGAAAPAAKPASEQVIRIAPRMPGQMPGMPGRPQMMPRAPAKAENFVEGDFVVYPTHGVGKVERIATEEIAGHKLELIHITFEENRMTLRVPVQKARTAGLRKLSTRKQFDDALAVLKGRARVKRTMWSRRAQEYEAKINSGDPLAVAEVVRDLHRNAGQPDQSFSERQIYEAALDRLAAELAALDQTDKPAAITKLSEYLKVHAKPAAAADAEADAE